jgi:hypothetical protein
MASYKTGFDPPNRPGDPARSRRIGTYTQPESSRSRSRNREADIAHISGQTESRMGQAPLGSSKQTGVPRPNLSYNEGERAASTAVAFGGPVDRLSPSTRYQAPETRKPSTSGTASRFGFGKSATKAAAPELKSKSSRNVLRRKPSMAMQPPGGSRSAPEGSGSSSPTKWTHTSTERRPSIEAQMRSQEAYNGIFTRPSAASTTPAQPRIIPELDRYRTRPEQSAQSHKFQAGVPRLATQDLPPPTPLSSGTSDTPVYGMNSNHNRYSGYSGSGYSASPSTRFSESPGPGAYSRDTTPTSISSQSPGIIAPIKTTTPRLLQGSPAFSRPPVTRRRAGSTPNEVEGPIIDTHGLPELRESITSSSSNSTVKGDGKTKTPDSKEKKKKKKRLSPLPPSPPPRKSSTKFKESPPSNKSSPSKTSKAPAKPVMMSPLEDSPLLPPPRNVFGHKRNTSSSSNTSIPPMRPSREGTPNIVSQIGDSIPIIQSNLAGLSYKTDKQGRRASITPIPRVTSPPAQQPRLQTGLRLPSRNPSPSPVLTSPREATPAPSGLGIIPDLRPQPSARAQASRTPSPSVANTRPRFGIFARRMKTAPEVPTLETSKGKEARKGPAAGTGHEGYGRYGLRGRSSSAGPFSNRNRSTSAASSSQESLASTRTHDPFLLERMSPVIIAGGGEILENRNASSELSRTESNTSLLLGRPSVESKGSSHETSRATLWPSALPRDPSDRTSTIIPKGRRPSDSSDDGRKPPSLAFRRSIQKIDTSSGTLNLPKPLDLSGMGVSPSVRSLQSSLMSDESQPEVDRGRKGSLTGSVTKPKKLEKRAKSPRKWNFFHRQPKAEPKTEEAEAVQVAIGIPPVKSVPHYALLDSSDEQQGDPMDLEDILREADAEVVELTDKELDELQFNNYKENLRRIEDLNVMMDTHVPLSLPERSPMIFSSPEPMHSTPELQQQPTLQTNKETAPLATPETELHLKTETAPVRPSRLPQVGRIPKVISARPVATSPKSFSRPFARLSLLQPPSEPVVLDKESIALGPTPPKSSSPVRSVDETELRSLGPRQDSVESSGTAGSHRDFLAFSPRKNSEATTSSSGALSFAGTTAIIPEANAALEEDEVWDEYDDLIGNNTTIKTPASATSSHGLPFQYESYESRRMRKSHLKAKELPAPLQAPTIQEPDLSDNEERQLFRRSQLATSSVYSADMTSRMRDTLATVQTPTTPMSFGDFFAGYGDRNNSVSGDSGQKPRQPSASSRKSTGSGHRRSGSELVSVKEEERENSSPISQVNLRVGSMTVSKWLTFGHVLFSPAREEIIGLEKRKSYNVCVIDGLGNGSSSFAYFPSCILTWTTDDWSFYAAETYPSATFYNLSPTHPLPATAPTSSSFPLTPPNHRQIHFPSTTSNERFPFPPSFFHVLVLRFPSAMPASSYHHLISEAKRVLRPGGYLEMAILDLDLRDMGIRSRRTVRALKTRMQEMGEGEGVHTGSASDVIMKSVGRKGFGEVRMCYVGVPVASAIPSSATASVAEAKGKGKEKEEMSLADMLKSNSNDPFADEGITKMVAKVGRWWYSRCYESFLGGRAENGSGVSDPDVLRECEEWKSSFKLCVAHAQKPLERRRRTLSV